MLKLVDFLHISLKINMQVTKKCRHTGSISQSKVVNPWCAWRAGVFTWINVVTVTGVSTLHSDYESAASGARAGSGDSVTLQMALLSL